MGSNSYLLAVLGCAISVWTGSTPRVLAAEGEKDDLPYVDKVTWDVSLLESNEENFKCVKRTVTSEAINWVLEVKSDTATNYLRQLDAFGANHVAARFTDPDDVQVTKINLASNTTDLFKGQKVRLTLTLPNDEIVKKTKNIQIKFERGQYGTDFPLPKR